MTRTILVTGAATGIGRAIANRFAEADYRVGAFDLDEVGLASLASQIGDRAEVITGRMDVRSPEDWQQALDSLVGDGGLDVLVNNAGILQSGPFAEIPLADQTRTVEVNVIGVLNGCHASYPHLKRVGGQVLNLCSASAIYGQPELATYSATKFAVRGLTEALDLEWAADGIKVSALWPLFVRTHMTDDLDIGSTRSLGIHLDVEDVADQAWKAVTASRQLSPHRPVGLQSRISMAASSIAPAPLTRLVNRYLTNK
jgi:NAD(P)-dependent dehydrogenase (short-subunit alcohol dehydrogenase family)